MKSRSNSPFIYEDKSYFSTPKKKNKSIIEENKEKLFSAKLAYYQPKYIPKQHAGSLLGVPYGKYIKNRDFRNKTSKNMTEGYVSRCGKDFVMSGKDKIETLRTEVNNLIGNKKRRPQEAYVYKVNKFTGEINPNKQLVRLGNEEADADVIAALSRDNIVPIKIGAKLKYVSPSKDLIFAKRGKKNRKSPIDSKSISRYSRKSPSVKSNRSRSNNRKKSPLEESIEAKVRARIKADTDREYDRIKGFLKRERSKSRSTSFSPRKRRQRLPEDILEGGQGRPKAVYMLNDNNGRPITKTVNYLEVRNPDYQYSDLSLNVNLDTTEYERKLREDMYKKKKRRMEESYGSKSPSKYKGISTYEWENKILEDTAQYYQDKEMEEEMLILDAKQRKNDMMREKLEKGRSGNHRANLKYEIDADVTDFGQSTATPGDLLDKVESLIYN